MEQVFFIADFHLGDHDVFTKDENGKRKEILSKSRDKRSFDWYIKDYLDELRIQSEKEKGRGERRMKKANM